MRNLFIFEDAKKFYRELFMFVSALVLIIGFPVLGDSIQHNYKQVCQVYEVHETYTTLIDPCGYLWDIYDTDYAIGDTVKVSFHDNFTYFNREDDVILKVKRVK